MAYRYDPDLEFLGKLSSSELSDLVYLLTHDKDGGKRWTESLTSNEKYKRFYPHHVFYWKEIAEEIQCFGGNSFANLFRGGHGVLYKEVLCDVCDKLKVNYNKYSSVKMIEENLLQKLLQVSLEKMSPEEIDNIGRELGVDAATSQAKLAAFLALFRSGGFKSYQITLIIVNQVFKALFNRSLTLAANATIVRVASIATGPIGWAITGLWSAVDLAGTAYRVTIPAVIQVAYLRKLFENWAEIEKAEIEKQQ